MHQMAKLLDSIMACKWLVEFSDSRSTVWVGAVSHQKAVRGAVIEVPSLCFGPTPPVRLPLVTRLASAWRSASTARVGRGDVVIGDDENQHEHKGDAKKMDQILSAGIQVLSTKCFDGDEEESTAVETG
mgnify:CR=1 FL=1